MRLGTFDVLIGINLLREGLDLPEVALVAILDADKEGFLRSVRSLVQTAGRAARNINGKIILYADRITDSIHKAMDESSRRRNRQLSYNQKNNLEPQTVKRRIDEKLTYYEQNEPEELLVAAEIQSTYESGYKKDENRGKSGKTRLKELEKEMKDAAQKLDFEKAARIRDMISQLRSKP